MYQFNQQPYNSYQSPRPNTITWVQGIEGAKAYQMMPNTNQLLMDSENENIMYIKSCDQVGMCNLRTFKYQEVSMAHPSAVDLTQYVTKDELKKMIKDITGKDYTDEQFVSTINAEAEPKRTVGLP